jgi:MFS family permease
MLWGDFCLQLMDSGLAPSLLTLQLNKQGASNAQILLIGTSIVQVMQTIMVPIVSTWSDRRRGRLGRRMPFMLYSTPFIALFLAMLGFSPAIAQSLHDRAPHLLGIFSVSSLAIALIATANTLYQFFDTFPQSVYYYLWTDVIPEKLMGTFACLFRVCSTAGVYVFNRWLIKHCDDHPGALCVGAGALYMITFVLLCFMVKEGDYPPPEPRKSGGIRRVWESVRAFVDECFTHAFYWKIYLYNLFFMVGFIPCARLLILYATTDLHMDLAQYGTILARRDLVQMAVFFALGPIVDLVHPIRAGFVGYVMLLISGAACFFFIHGPTSFAVCVIGMFVAVAVYQGALGALGPRLLPKDKYGQFCSANSMVWHLGVAAGVYVCGKFLDIVGNRRWVFGWFFVFTLAGMITMWMVYLDWKKLGGDENYVAPLTPPG